MARPYALKAHTLKTCSGWLVGRGANQPSIRIVRALRDGGAQCIGDPHAEGLVGLARRLKREPAWRWPITLACCAATAAVLRWPMIHSSLARLCALKACAVVARALHWLVGRSANQPSALSVRSSTAILVAGTTLRGILRAEGLYGRCHRVAPTRDSRPAGSWRTASES